MKAVYETILKVTIVHDLNTLENVKNNAEFSQDMAEMICDEAAMAGGVATYEILDSHMDII